MIGVIAHSSEYPVVREFFQLFKTPWEFYSSDRQYDVLVCACDQEFPKDKAKLVLIYGGRRLRFDTEEKIEIASQGSGRRMLLYKGSRIPIYGDHVTFRGITSALVDEQSRRPLLCLYQSCGRVVGRLGFALFAEIRTLLTVGQPVSNADIPTLELHIALLRDLIVESGIPLVEIPPVPVGYRFLACLTHDVDHASLRKHKFDHTMFGFLYRAIIGSVIRVFQGRLPVRGLLSNWTAAFKLPFVHLGFTKDLWYEFDRYIQLEKGAHSSFFVIPYKNRPGQSGQGSAPNFRASQYAAADIAAKIQTLLSAGCEIGVHGIDAWLDSAEGQAELEQIRRITGAEQIGVRMHWLYFDEQSPAILEKAGADYDSTIGYNETIGYRAGTTQVYKPLAATRLLELPLHVMDTALFFSNHLDLSAREASKRVGHIIDSTVQLGGCVTVNWHDRSIAPERLWGDFYMDLVEELKNRGAWVSTAAQAVSWFRKRRSAVFEDVSWESDELRVEIALDATEDLPPLQLRVHNGSTSSQRIIEQRLIHQ